ncbi:MAG: outer membrane protein assembly factor BamA [Gammaproteobacteria bacterium]|nr:outer membrane protein assembly factor BamA [Gammaproteobacteria bacterium]
MTLLKKILFAVFISSIFSIASAETFVIKKINVHGLHRISLGTVLSYLSDLQVKAGARIDSSETPDIIRALYKTGFFSDVSVGYVNNSLLINVVERSVIGILNVSGNHKITKKQLIDALKGVGIAEGQALDPAVLNAMKQAIVQEYYNKGLYDAKISIDVKAAERSRVIVTIRIQEGPVAKIKSISIVGNKAFSERKLRKELSLTTTKPWSFITSSDQYSSKKLEADLERLRYYYMDRGYLHEAVNSSKVSITPNKKGIYIVINITEGPLYRLGGFSIDGDLIGKRAEILKLITIKAGDVFSRKDIIDTQSKINLFLGDYGYGMPDIKVDPDVNEKNKKVWVKFIVHPGHRLYIHNISFTGNYKTNDDVLRREMRIQEGSMFSLSKIQESRRQLANLGYLQGVDYKVTPVDDANNQVDLLYNAKETSAISANFQGGYSDKDGFIYGASLNDQNVFGAGKTAFIRFDNTKATQSYGLGYRDPYFTQNHIGFSLNGYLNKVDPNKINGDLSSYRTSTYGAIASFDAPFSDYTYASLGLGVEHINITSASSPNDEYEAFLSKHGKVYNQLKLVATWSYSNMDQAIFPTQGFAQSINGQLYGPLDRNSLEFYTIDYQASWYQSLFKGFIFHTTAEIAYGDGIGKTGILPPFKNFFAGGIGSVRGFESDSLTTNKEDADKDRAIGGNLLTLASASIIIPTPMKDTIRPSIFIDVGNVYPNYFKFEDLRASYGIQIEWRTPIAPLVFSFAKPLKKKSWDRKDLFQFSISTSI